MTMTSPSVGISGDANANRGPTVIVTPVAAATAADPAMNPRREMPPEARVSVGTEWLLSVVGKVGG